MNMPYKRIAKGFTTYALYPNDYENDRIIVENGEHRDYYQSIFEYKDHHYSKYIKSLKQACDFLDLKFDEKNKLNLTGPAIKKLKQLSKAGDNEAKKILGNLSVSGTEDIETKKIVFDFDSNDDLSMARSDSVTAIERLIDIGFKPNALEVCFSGNKGFSIEAPLNEYISQEQFENIIYTIAGDLPTFDSKVKDPQRLFRMPLTKHNSSGLFKIPLTLNELKTLSIKEITNEAKELSTKHFDLVDTWNKSNNLPEALKNLKKREEKKQEVKEVEHLKVDLDFSQKPPWMSEARYLLQEGFFKRGNRNEAFMILATTYKLAGFDDTQTFYLLEAVADKQAQRNSEERKDSDDIQNEIIDVVFSPSWKGGIYSEDSNSLLLELIEQYGLRKFKGSDKPKTLDDMHKTFAEFAKNIDKNTIKTGIKNIDENVLITTGMMIPVLGAPSSGKTSFALNFLRNMSKIGEKCFFFSLDMPDNLIYSRLVQMFAQKSLSLSEILNKFKNGDTELINEAFDKMKEELANVYFETRSGTSIEDIRNKIEHHINSTGENPKLIVVDYLEKVHGKYSDPTQNSGHIGSSLADIARDFNCCVLLLVQPQKSAGDPSDPLLSMRKIKGSSRLEQDARVIFTVWRPGFNPQDNSQDDFMSIAVVKNNMGSVGQYDFKWGGANGTIEEMTMYDKAELENLIKEKERKKKEQEDDFF